MAGACRRSGLRAVAVVMTIAAVIAVSGCGSASSVTKTVTHTTSAAASSSASVTSTAAPAPAAGPGRLNGKNGGFSTVVPHGWRSGAGIVKDETGINLQYVVVGSRTGGFLTNINVVREATPSTDVVAVAHASIKVLHAVFSSMRDMSPLQALTVAGSPAREFNYFTETGTHKQLHVRQIVVLHGGYAYTITDTALAPQYAGSVSALDQVVGGWLWQ